MVELLWGATLGDRIRVARVRARLNQAELARRIGVSTNAMNRLEIGITTDPHASRITAIADVLDVSTDYLLGRSAQGNRPVPRVPQQPDARQTRRRPTSSRRPVARTNGHTPVAETAEPQPARRCPHCGTNMQPLDEGTRLTCPGCHHTVAEAT
jgi:transcriptional regulator with XRE-family HTH domain